MTIGWEAARNHPLAALARLFGAAPGMGRGKLVVTAREMQLELSSEVALRRVSVIASVGELPERRRSRPAATLRQTQDGSCA